MTHPLHVVWHNVFFAFFGGGGGLMITIKIYIILLHTVNNILVEKRSIHIL